MWSVQQRPNRQQQRRRRRSPQTPSTSTYSQRIGRTCLVQKHCRNLRPAMRLHSPSLVQRPHRDVERETHRAAPYQPRRGPGHLRTATTPRRQRTRRIHGRARQRAGSRHAVPALHPRRCRHRNGVYRFPARRGVDKVHQPLVPGEYSFRKLEGGGGAEGCGYDEQGGEERGGGDGGLWGAVLGGDESEGGVVCLWGEGVSV